MGLVKGDIFTIQIFHLAVSDSSVLYWNDSGKIVVRTLLQERVR